MPNCTDSYWTSYPWNNGVHSWDDLAAFAASTLADPSSIVAKIDGKDLVNLAAYRAKAPDFSYTVTSDNINSHIFTQIFGVPITYSAGTYGPAGSDGYWVMLTPLTPGSHTVHFASGDGWLDVTYHLTVGR